MTESTLDISEEMIKMITDIEEKRGKETLLLLIKEGWCNRKHCEASCPIHYTEVCNSCAYFDRVKSIGQSTANDQLNKRRREEEKKPYEYM